MGPRQESLSVHKGRRSGCRRRLVQKDGECNLSVCGGRRVALRYLRDAVNTLVDMPWRWLLLLAALSFWTSWLAFAVLWWLVALTHGDLHPDHLPSEQGSSGWTPCVTEIFGFLSCFLFSVENQHTTGFGTRAPTEECPEAVFLLCAQSMFGVAWQSLVLGLVYAKAIRPKKRAHTLLFSRHAVVCRRSDGRLCLAARVADARRSNLAEAKVRMQLVLVSGSKMAAGGGPHQEEVVEEVVERTELRLDSRDSDTGFYLLWPEALVHVIDERSPLYGASAADLARARHLEVIVVLEATIEATDQRVQMRTSYLPDEILWGHRFRSVLSYDESLCRYRVDLGLFDCTYPVQTPRCSARELDERGSNHEDLHDPGTKQPSRLESSVSWSDSGCECSQQRSGAS